jgi:hypothetical protein
MLPPEQSDEVFICWSGERSHSIAKKLRDWLSEVIGEPKDKFFVSEQLEKGVEWFPEIVKKLEKARVGILCLTPENLRSTWLHFEAGALAKQVGAARIYTYLHGVKPADLSGPLANYQSTTTARDDTASLVQSLAGVMRVEKSEFENLDKRFKKDWREFEEFLRNLHISVPEVFPDFESLFRRKTFNEPLKKCAEQNWVGRYDGAQQTHEALQMQLPVVRNACPRQQIDLYEMLIEQVEGYAMVIDALLLRAKSPPFSLDNDGELEIPCGIDRACETRREGIKETVSRILDPRTRPLTDDAVRFYQAEKFFDKKVFVHRMEHRIIDHKAALKKDGKSERGRDANKALLGETGLELEDYRKSEWDLDRIYAYLIAENLADQTAEQTCLALKPVRMELETVNAQSGSPSLMPLHYALGALENVIPTNPENLEEEDRTAVEKQLGNVKHYLDKINKNSSDAGGQSPRRGENIYGTLEEIRGKIRPSADKTANLADAAGLEEAQ